ncbi:hypothetical protein [Aminivibrio sp.]|jgi:dihydroorotate dehydrogenase electron transfer subunit|uniref:iron-sulfur cluster-binding protein n=1 Tax=Aminivibrio sp. TaxID=1872489 RepID=UPI001A3AE512|nr:hypothetical protein [Aminivibrio sp.]MBL3540272.1 hypothetical protein [Aminivibrio sp.]MDK2958844.1 dihydroorotate dehydrogenase electron transfer subunit [Synergistaceae bacterium]
MRVERTKLLYNYEVKPGYMLMAFRADSLRDARPGQFLSVSAPDALKEGMLLRRPFTFYRLDGNLVQVMYKIVGEGTHLFASLEAGAGIDVLGPKGNAFSVSEKTRALLLARGVGLASLVFLGETLAKKGREVVTVGSFKDKNADLVDGGVEGFSKRLYKLFDGDGSSAPENVERILAQEKPDVVYTCGSKRLIRMLQKMDVEAFATLEERMGCGLGACYGCGVNTVEGYKRVCHDGPCFNVKEVIV